MANEKEKRSPGGPQRDEGFGDLRHYVPADILDISFPAAVRGYDRNAVDAYVRRVNRAIAELKVSASPPAAVRHALDQAGQQVHGLLQSARETAEEITASARHEADDNTARAKAEAADLVVGASTEADRLRKEGDDAIAGAKATASQIVADARAEAQNILAHARAEADERLQQLREELAAMREEAEARMTEIHADSDAVWKHRGELIDDIRTMAGALMDVANAAGARLTPREPEEAEPEEAQTEDETPAMASATSEPDT